MAKNIVWYFLYNKNKGYMIEFVIGLLINRQDIFILLYLVKIDRIYDVINGVFIRNTLYNLNDI